MCWASRLLPTAPQWRLQESHFRRDEMTRPSGHVRHNPNSAISFNCWTINSPFLICVRVTNAAVTKLAQVFRNLMFRRVEYKVTFLAFFQTNTLSVECVACAVMDPSVLLCVIYISLPGSLILLSILVSHLRLVLRIIQPLIQPATSSPHTTVLHFH